jgi:hypothetical protein
VWGVAGQLDLPHGEGTSGVSGKFRKATVGCSSSIDAWEKYMGGEEQVMMGEEQMAVEGMELLCLVHPTLIQLARRSCRLSHGSWLPH